MKRKGPCIEPWGTPFLTSTFKEINDIIEILESEKALISKMQDANGVIEEQSDNKIKFRNNI